MRFLGLISCVLALGCSVQSGVPTSAHGKEAEVGSAPAPTGYSDSCAKRLRDIAMSGVEEAKEVAIDLANTDAADAATKAVVATLARLSAATPELGGIEEPVDAIDARLKQGRIIHVVSTEVPVSFAFDANGALIASMVDDGAFDFYCEDGDAAAALPADAYADYCGGAYLHVAPHGADVVDVVTEGKYVLGTDARSVPEDQAQAFTMVEEAGTHYLRANAMNEVDYRMTYWESGAIDGATVELGPAGGETVTYFVARHVLVWGVTPIVVDWVDSEGVVHAVCERRDDDDGTEPAEELPVEEPADDQPQP